MGGWDRAAPSRLVQPGPRDCPANPLEGGYSCPARRAQGLQRGDPSGTMHWLRAGNRVSAAGVYSSSPSWAEALDSQSLVRDRGKAVSEGLRVSVKAQTPRAVWPCAERSSALDPVPSPARQEEVAEIWTMPSALMSLVSALGRGMEGGEAGPWLWGHMGLQ